MPDLIRLPILDQAQINLWPFKYIAYIDTESRTVKTILPGYSVVSERHGNNNGANVTNALGHAMSSTILVMDPMFVSAKRQAQSWTIPEGGREIIHHAGPTQRILALAATEIYFISNRILHNIGLVQRTISIDSERPSIADETFERMLPALNRQRGMGRSAKTHNLPLMHTLEFEDTNHHTSSIITHSPITRVRQAERYNRYDMGDLLPPLLIGNTLTFRECGTHIGSGKIPDVVSVYTNSISFPTPRRPIGESARAATLSEITADLRDMYDMYDMAYMG
jgi:hypothetical protein